MASRRRARAATAPRCVSCWSRIAPALRSAPGCSISYKGLHVTAPAALRERIGRGNGARLAERLVRMRDRPGASLHEQAMLTVLRDLARRARQLDEQAGRYRREITRLVRELTQRSWMSPASARSAPPSSWSATQHASERSRVCALQRHRATARLVRPDDPPPPLPRRRPPSQQRDPHDRDEPIHQPRRVTRLPRTQNQPRQTRREAMRALKRHVSRRLYNQLTQPLDTIEASK